MVRHPDYELSAVASARVHNDGGIPSPDFLGFQTCAKLLRVKVRSEVRERKIDLALRDAETIGRASQASPFDTLISQLIRIATKSIGTDAWNEAIRTCDDPALLRSTLTAQNSLAVQASFFGETEWRSK